LTQANTPSVLRAAVIERCTRCGEGGLFKGYLDIAGGCAKCGLDFAGFDVGDGPAVFVILIVGAVVAGGALFVEFTWHPPYWVHAVLWLPILLVLSIGLLRIAKALLLVLQYRHQAREGRLVQ